MCRAGIAPQTSSAAGTEMVLPPLAARTRAAVSPQVWSVLALRAARCARPRGRLASRVGFSRKSLRCTSQVQCEIKRTLRGSAEKFALYQRGTTRLRANTLPFRANTLPLRANTYRAGTKESSDSTTFRSTDSRDWKTAPLSADPPLRPRLRGRLGEGRRAKRGGVGHLLRYLLAPAIRTPPGRFRRRTRTE